MLRAENIKKSYHGLDVLKGVTLQAKKGEIISIVGASGAGKTTLLQILGTLEKPDSGTLLINDTDVISLKGKKIAAFRNKHIGFIFQFHQLLPEFNALENVAISAMIGGVGKKEAEAKAMILLQELGLEKRALHKPNALSGGEQQRVAVARALINDPDVILADEPSGNLDSNTAKDLHEQFFKLREKHQQTFIIVTHNSELANMADRKLTISDGKIL
jgi:lipoprotein-releasing system ATP-binding protein